MPPLRLLGCPRLHCGAGEVDLPDTLPGYLVAYLGARGQWVPRDELAALLWPQESDSAAHNNLRVNLARLRSQLERWGVAERLVTERRRLRLELESDVRQLRAAHLRRDWAVAAESPGAPFLDGLSFRAFGALAEWTEGERRALHRIWRDALLNAARDANPAQRHELAMRGLAADPCDEECQQQCLDALTALGRSAEIPRMQADFAARVHEQLGTGPSAAMAVHPLRQEVDGSAAGFAGDDPLFGRDAELARAIELISTEPLLVVLGLGGIGKTRLARQLVAATTRADRTQLWLPLAEVRAVAEIAPRLAELLDLSPGGDQPVLEQVTGRLADASTLLVLDNAEPLLGERALLHALLDRLLDTCPRLRCVLTSRESLQHPRECSLRLEGLQLPVGESVAAAMESPAVRLFVHHARRHRASLDARAAASELAQIARATGGMPLALRIAAAWAGILSCADVVAELRRGLDALEPGDDAGVRATLARSWARLGEPERRALACLSVFVSPFSAQAAHEVAQAGLPLLAALVECCLVSRTPLPDDAQRARFELHPLVRNFAAEQLARRPALQHATREQHLAWIARTLAAGSEDVHRPDHGRALQAAGRHLPDAVAAWRWALGHGRADFVARATPVLSSYFLQKGRAREALDLFAPAEAQLDAALPSERAALAAVVLARGRAHFAIGDPGTALEFGRRALDWSRALGHHAGTRDALVLVSTTLLRQGAVLEACPVLDEALALTRAAGDAHGEASVLAQRALLRWTQGEREPAWAEWRDALNTYRRLGDGDGAGRVSANLGRSLMEARRFDEALPLLEDGLRLCDEYGLAAVYSPMLANIAQLHHEAGRPAAARSFALRSLQHSRRVGMRRSQAATLLLLTEIELRDDQPGAAAMRLAEALRLARHSSDLPNHLGALGAYGLWCLRLGRPAAAATAWRVVLAHPQLPAQIRLWTERDWSEARFDAATAAQAERDASAIDAATLTDWALAELEASEVARAGSP